MAATDPVEHIQHQRFESPFVEDLQSVVKSLASLPPSTDVPYLTLTLDWRPDGTRPEVRTGRVFFDQQMDEFMESTGFHAHTPQHESLTADIDKIRSFLGGEVDPAVQGLAFVACSAKDTFTALPLGMPLPNHIALGPTPAMRVLAKLAEDEPPFAVLLLDQKHATLDFYDQTSRLRNVEVTATGFPRKQMQGGWSQRRYQMRADERVEAFARIVADETRRAMESTGADLLVLAGNEQITTTLREDLHSTIQERIAGMVRLDVHASESDILSASLPVIEQAQRERESEIVGRIENGAGPGGGAATGPEETLTALQAGQVMMLVMNDDFTAPGWADFSMPIYGVGNPPKSHPAGGEAFQIVPVALEEELVRLGVQSDANVQIVRTRPPVTSDETVNEVDGSFPRTEAAQRLDRLGGVAALLRFALAENQSTPHL